MRTILLQMLHLRTRMHGWLLTQLRNGRRSPLFWIYLAAIVMRLPGLFWGLPSTDGWDDDAVAPRDFLPGLVQTFTPGEYYTYPPVHLVILALVTSPIWLFKLATAATLEPKALIAAFVSVPTMTAFAVCARIVAIGFALVTIHATTSLGALMVPAANAARVRKCIGALLLGNAAFTYYGQVGNLDGPYIAWACLAMLEVARSLQQGEPRRLYRFSLYAALAVATKDQAYALFLLSIPTACLLGLPRYTKSHSFAVVARTLVQVALLALVLVLVFDAAPFNPHGFLARIRFLLGPASQDHAYYTKDWAGRLRLLSDIFELRPSSYYCAPIWLLLPAGLLIAQRAQMRRVSAFAVRMLPLLAAISFTLTFNFTARRTEHRFLLPQATLCAIYMGIALAALVRTGFAGRAFGAALVCGGLAGSAGIDASILGEPRYQVEAWLAKLPPGTRVEVYGNNVYLPRIPSNCSVQRAGDDPVARRGVVPNFTEIQANPAQAADRDADVLIVTNMWSGPFYWAAAPTTPGYMPSAWLKAESKNQSTRAFLDALREGRTAYHLALDSKYAEGLLPSTGIHASTNHRTVVYSRLK